MTSVPPLQAQASLLETELTPSSSFSTTERKTPFRSDSVESTRSIASPSNLGHGSSPRIVPPSPSPSEDPAFPSSTSTSSTVTTATTPRHSHSRSESRQSISKSSDGYHSEHESSGKRGSTSSSSSSASRGGLERRKNNERKSSVSVSPYERRLCSPIMCTSRAKPKKRFSRSDRRLLLNTIDSDIFINEYFPLELSLESGSSPTADIKLRIDLYDVSTNKRIKEPVLEFEDGAPVFHKGLLGATIRVRVTKLVLQYEGDSFYIKVRGDYGSVQSNRFTVIARYRVVLVGDSGCGKSWLVDEYLQAQDIQHEKKEYGEGEYEPRLLGGVSDPDRRERSDSKRQRGGDGKIMREMKFQVEVRGRPVHILLFDTSGDKDFKEKLFVLNQETDFVLLCFSLIDYDSYDHLTEWKEEIMKLAPRATFAVAGLKKDIRDKREIEVEGDPKKKPEKPDILEEWGSSWATRNESVFYVECSTKEPDTIEIAFKKMVLHLTGVDQPIVHRSSDRTCSTCSIS